MAIVPPNNNFGQFNTDAKAPVPWDSVQPSNNETINRNEMPFTSTVEYKGYYKAQSTGTHTFTLEGSDGVTAYSWLSSAPESSDHITVIDSAKSETTLNKSYGIIIPPKLNNYWPFEDRNVLGTNFTGYGYWPRNGIGNQSGWSNYYDGNNSPNPTCGYSTGNPLRVTHRYFVPGDIRTYGRQYADRLFNKPAGPGWTAPEDPNFESPCFTNGTRNLPLYRLQNNFTPVDIQDLSATHQTVGKSSQIFLDRNFKAEGTGDEDWATYRTIDVSNDIDPGDHIYIWPSTVNVNTTLQGTRVPQRVNVRFGLRLYDDEQDYTFEWRSRDALKMWYMVGGGDGRNFRKCPNDIEGMNPSNLFSNNTSVDPNDSTIGVGWEPGGGLRGWTGTIRVPKNGYIQFQGQAVGDPSQDTHGWSLIIKNEAGEIVWTTAQLLAGSEDRLIGIDECGYHALLKSEQRVVANKGTEFYTLDGWKGYTNDGSGNQLFTADFLAGDDVERDIKTTRQYLWSNTLAKSRGGAVIPGSVYLRQGDYYFIRVIASNHKDRSASFRFSVRSPSGSNTDVRFTGKGNPNVDPTVGGSAGGNGIAINESILCNPNGPFWPGDAVPAQDVNFAMIDRMSVVLNLNAFGVSDYEIGREGQAEIIEGEELTGTASKLITFKDANDENVNISITQLVRGGQPGIPELSPEERTAVILAYQDQITPDENGVTASLSYNTFRSAITSQAVIQWGKGGNYPYIYHTVAEVIESICKGVPINPPVLQLQTPELDQLQLTSNLSKGLTTDETCFDIDFTALNDGQAQVTSECLTDCKIPDDYLPLTSQYTVKKDSDYASFDSRWKSMIRIFPEWGNQNKFVTVDKLSKAGNKVAKAIARQDPINLKPGVISCQPLTIPDIFIKDEDAFFEESAAQEDVSVTVELSSNTFPKDFNDAGTEVGINRPYIVMWFSAVPAGPSLGRYHISTMPTGQTYRDHATLSYRVYKENPNGYTAYLGNKYGVRYVNFVTLKKAEVKDTYNFNIPEVGSTEFVDIMSDIGYQSNEIRTYTTVPSPDCSTTTSNRTTNTLDGTGNSLSNMKPYVGDDWNGTVPNHVEIATNGGFTWSSQPGGNMTAYPRGIGPGNESPRLTGNAIWFPQPLNGKILSYEWLSSSNKVVPAAQYGWVRSPAGGQPVLLNCSPQLTVVRWFSATPGGRPLLNVNGDRNIYDIGDAEIDPRFDIQQLYDVNDSSNDDEYTIPIVDKTYFLNAACIEVSLLATLQSEGRAPTASEVRVFDPKACGSDYSYMYIVGGPRGKIYDWDEWWEDYNK